MPDIYQGTEFWDLSLVDPDNRRRPDFEAHRRALAAVLSRGALDAASVEELMRKWRDGRIKMHVLATLLQLRREWSSLFQAGTYRGVSAEGPMADRVIAFTNR